MSLSISQCGLETAHASDVWTAFLHTVTTTPTIGAQRKLVASPPAQHSTTAWARHSLPRQACQPNLRKSSYTPPSKRQISGDGLTSLARQKAGPQTRSPPHTLWPGERRDKKEKENKYRPELQANSICRAPSPSGPVILTCDFHHDNGEVTHA